MAAALTTSTNGAVDGGIDTREPVLELRGASIGYGSIPVVRDLSLHVHRGEILALLGANGAGKTTTIMALAGVLSLGAGDVVWLGRPVRTPLHVRAREGLGFVPEERSVISSLTARDNLRLGRGSVERAVAIFPELEPLLPRRAGLLSGGEQQMLTLARALAGNPKVLLVDELSLGLAPLIVARLLAAVRGAADAGVGVVLVEQQVRNALAVSDRACVFRRGRVVLEGRSDELRERTDEIEQAYLATESAASIAHPAPDGSHAPAFAGGDRSDHGVHRSARCP